MNESKIERTAKPEVGTLEWHTQRIESRKLKPEAVTQNLAGERPPAASHILQVGLAAAGCTYFTDLATVETVDWPVVIPDETQRLTIRRAPHTYIDGVKSDGMRYFGLILAKLGILKAYQAIGESIYQFSVSQRMEDIIEAKMGKQYIPNLMPLFQERMPEIVPMIKKLPEIVVVKEAPVVALAKKLAAVPDIPAFDPLEIMQQIRDGMAEIKAQTAKKPVGRPRKPKAATSSDPGLEGELPRIDAKDPYYWSDFILQYRNQKIKTREEQAQFLHDMHRVFAVVLLAKPLYVFKSCPKDVFSIHTTPPDRKTQPYFYYNLVDGPGDGEGVRKWFLDWAALDTLSYQRVDCIPYHPHLGMPPLEARTLNTFGGFIANFVGDENGRISGKQKEKIQLFLNHVREVIAAGDDFVYRYIMGWYRGLLLPDKNGEIKMTLISPLIKGLQRAGKNRPLDMLRNHVFGHNCSMETDGPQALTARFNPELAGKILVVVNESKESEGDVSFSKTDSEKLKNRITGETLWVEGKGTNKVEYTNRLNITFCSNHNLSLHTTQDDGRIPQFDISAHRVGDHDYFVALSDSFTQEAGDILYTYLLSDEVETMDLKTIPKTQSRMDAIELSMGAPDRFLLELLAGRVAIPKSDFHNKAIDGREVWMVTTYALRLVFQDWLRDNMPSSKPCSDKAFTLKIKGGPGAPSKHFKHHPNVKIGRRTMSTFEILEPAFDLLAVMVEGCHLATGEEEHLSFREAILAPSSPASSIYAQLIPNHSLD